MCDIYLIDILVELFGRLPEYSLVLLFRRRDQFYELPVIPSDYGGNSDQNQKDRHRHDQNLPEQLYCQLLIQSCRVMIYDEKPVQIHDIPANRITISLLR